MDTSEMFGHSPLVSVQCPHRGVGFQLIARLCGSVTTHPQILPGRPVSAAGVDSGYACGKGRGFRLRRRGRSSVRQRIADDIGGSLPIPAETNTEMPSASDRLVVQPGRSIQPRHPPYPPPETAGRSRCWRARWLWLRRFALICSPQANVAGSSTSRAWPSANWPSSTRHLR